MISFLYAFTPIYAFLQYQLSRTPVALFLIVSKTRKYCLTQERLFLSSYFPITGTRRLIYEIQKTGDKSLYNLYDEAIRFVWDVSFPIKGDRVGSQQGK